MNIENEPSIGEYFTFVPSKKKPVYNWFFYKEAYSPEIVDYFLDRFKVEKGLVADPFCGIGTTLLRAKERGLKSVGTDVSPLACFASYVKTRNYGRSDVEEGRRVLKGFFERRETPGIEWKSEIVDPQKALPKSNYAAALFIREKIESIENEKIKDLFLLALVSLIPQASLMIKDGGVLKYSRTKSVLPLKEGFRRKVKKMLKEIENTSAEGYEPVIKLGDARKFSTFAGESADAVITSPPYLNNIDYTKIYGLELSLFSMSEKTSAAARAEALRSFSDPNLAVQKVPPEIEELGIRYPAIGAYFADMEDVLIEVKKVLNGGMHAVFIVGNSVIFGEHIIVDEILANIGERLGFEAEIITSLKRYASGPKGRTETRESAVVLRKL
ncbi:hypothetical protein JXB01_03960 [Candidatus Micrarchaeota archaeon]|nr:hypothetical protein [Candidatus Micrarchaeota archaeon]